MRTSLSEGMAHYKLSFDDQQVDMNSLVGQHIEFNYNQKIKCSYCGRATKKSWSSGFCFPCSQSLARCDLCIMRPETCHHHLGTCREPDWGLSNCFKPHVVYIANTSWTKVGITTKDMLLNRWIEQGAISALPILGVKSRRESGTFEVALKHFVRDKSNWRKMLTNEVELSYLVNKKNSLLKEIS